MNEEIQIYKAHLISDGIHLEMPRTIESIELVRFFLNHLEKSMAKEEAKRKEDLFFRQQAEAHDAWFSKRDYKVYKVKVRRKNFHLRGIPNKG